MGPDYWSSRLNIDASSLSNAKASCDSDPKCHAVVYAAHGAGLKSGSYYTGHYYGMSGSPLAVACAHGDPFFQGWKYYYKGLSYIYPTPRASGFRHRDVTALGSCSTRDVGMCKCRWAAFGRCDSFTFIGTCHRCSLLKAWALWGGV